MFDHMVHQVSTAGYVISFNKHEGLPLTINIIDLSNMLIRRMLAPSYPAKRYHMIKASDLALCMILPVSMCWQPSNQYPG